MEPGLGYVELDDGAAETQGTGEGGGMFLQARKVGGKRTEVANKYSGK